MSYQHRRSRIGKSSSRRPLPPRRSLSDLGNASFLEMEDTTTCSPSSPEPEDTAQINHEGEESSRTRGFRFVLRAPTKGRKRRPDHLVRRGTTGMTMLLVQLQLFHCGFLSDGVLGKTAASSDTAIRVRSSGQTERDDAIGKDQDGLGDQEDESFLSSLKDDQGGKSSHGARTAMTSEQTASRNSANNRTSNVVSTSPSGTSSGISPSSRPSSSSSGGFAALSSSTTSATGATRGHDEDGPTTLDRRHDSVGERGLQDDNFLDHDVEEENVGQVDDRKQEKDHTAQAQLLSQEEQEEEQHVDADEQIEVKKTKTRGRGTRQQDPSRTSASNKVSSSVQKRGRARTLSRGPVQLTPTTASPCRMAADNSITIDQPTFAISVGQSNPIKYEWPAAHFSPAVSAADDGGLATGGWCVGDGSKAIGFTFPAQTKSSLVQEEPDADRYWELQEGADESAVACPVLGRNQDQEQHLVVQV
ncbi:unnamed protein product [Amoebophrya sp. A25]|nr:unnamed protein product [Amoebophrya sp. A25]|eukprot:GSA25T00019975001.1